RAGPHRCARGYTSEGPYIDQKRNKGDSTSSDCGATCQHLEQEIRRDFRFAIIRVASSCSIDCYAGYANKCKSTKFARSLHAVSAAALGGFTSSISRSRR